MKLVFYDFEVFSNDWMVVLIEEDRAITQKLDDEERNINYIRRLLLIILRIWLLIIMNIKMIFG